MITLIRNAEFYTPDYLGEDMLILQEVRTLITGKNLMERLDSASD